MDILNKYEVVAGYYKENPDFVRKIIDVFGRDIFKDCEILFNIMNNKQQFNLYARRSFRKSYLLSEILPSVNKDNILIYFADLGLYGLIDDFRELHTFTLNAVDIEEDTDSKINLKHVILSDKSQKTVVLSTDNSDVIVSKIKKYINDCLKSDINIINTPEGAEITIKEPVVDSYVHCCEIYDKLYRYISTRDSETADKIKLLPKKYSSIFTVTEPTIDIVGKSLDEITQLLNSVNLTGANVQINIACNKVNNVNNFVNNSKDPVTKWIRDNPPINGEKTTDYYARYEESFKGKSKIANSTFGKLVKQQGYDSYKSSGYRKWRV